MYLNMCWPKPAMPASIENASLHVLTKPITYQRCFHISYHVRIRLTKHEHFHNITRKHKIRLLTRYVDDILVIYDSITSNENDILQHTLQNKNQIYSRKWNRQHNKLLGLNHNKNPTKESNRSWNLSQTNQQHNSNPQQVKTSIPTKIKHIQ